MYGGALRASGEMASAQYITAGWCLEKTQAFRLERDFLLNGGENCS